jgi:hypothetical protein
MESNFINTPLQRGESVTNERANRFNGLPIAEETVETVSSTRAIQAPR